MIPGPNLVQNPKGPILIKIINKKKQKKKMLCECDRTCIVFFFYRYGQHFLAAMIYQSLSKHVSLEKLHFYLVAMSQISKAECILIHGIDYDQLLNAFPDLILLGIPQMTLLERLNSAINLYSMAFSTLKVRSK